jgi:hypothetical protein
VVDLAAVSAVTIDFGEPDGLGGANVYGEYPGLVGATALYGKDVAALWDYQVLRISQGAVSERGFIGVEATGQGVFTATIPFGYFLAGQTTGEYVFREIVYDASRILQDTIYRVDDSGAIGELTALPGSTLCPTIFHLTDPGTWTGDWECHPSAVEFDATRPTAIAFEDLGPGASYFAALWVTNAGLEGEFLLREGSRP